MNNDKLTNAALVAILSLAMLLLLCATVAAQSAQVQGVINGRSGATMSLQTDSGNVTVVLTDYTQVEDVQGIFHFRKKQMGLTALEPGLQVQVQGSYNAQNQLVANTVKFNGKDLQTATDIQAGVTPVEQQTQQQKQELAEQQAKLQQQQAQAHGGATGASRLDAGQDRRQQGCYCRCQQALRRTGRLQHLG